MSAYGQGMTIWLFICPNSDKLHRALVRVNDAPAFGEEFIEYLMVAGIKHEFRSEPVVNKKDSEDVTETTSLFFIKDERACLIMDEPSDLAVTTILTTLMGAKVLRISRPCRNCRAKGIKS